MVNKKGYLRTLEVVFAVLLTFIFIIYMLPTYITAGGAEESLDVLSPIKTNIRNCFSTTCVETAIIDFEANFANKFNYVINISDSSDIIVSGLPNERVFADSVFIAGNSTSYNPRIIRIYYFTR